MQYRVSMVMPEDDDLPPEIKAEVDAISLEIITARDRVAHDLIGMSISLYKLKEIMGKRFERHASEQFGFPRSTQWRYLKYASGFMTISRGLENPGHLLKSVTATALKLLDGADEDVLDEVREIAMRGEPINEALVAKLHNEKKTLQQRLMEAEVEINAKNQQNEDLAAQIKHLGNEVNAITVAASQSANIATANLRRADMLSEDVAGLESEVRKLKLEAEHLKTVVKVIEKQPEGHRDQDAELADRKSELERVERALEEKKRELADAESAQNRNLEQMKHAQDTHEEVLGLQAEFQTLCGRLSTTLHLKAPLLSHESKATLVQLADSLAAMSPIIHQHVR